MKVTDPKPYKDLTVTPAAWTITGAENIQFYPTRLFSLSITAVEQEDGTIKYAIRQGSNLCLNKKGE